MTKDEWYRQLFERLDNSKVPKQFPTEAEDIDYINEKGWSSSGRPAAGADRSGDETWTQ